MGGLLYKDFISLNRLGKLKATWVIAIVTIVYIILRIIFPGSTGEQVPVYNSVRGETVASLNDIIFEVGYAYFIIISVFFVLPERILGIDDKHKIKEYFATMPFKKNTYIASKYVFNAIAIYVIVSVDSIWGISCAAFCQEGLVLDSVSLINSSLISIVCIMLFLAALEIPLFVGLGKEKAKRVIVVFCTMVAIFVIGFLMFGDLPIIENLDVAVLIDFINDHKTEVILLQSIGPVVVLVLYYLSYRLAVYLYNNKKGEN